MKDKSKQPEQRSPGQPQQEQQGGGDNVHGEGNYKATRDYNRGVAEHMKSHDVEREARDAAPRSEEEARQMEQAEREGRKHSKGEGR
ncbi:MAG: hypothetical protein ACM3SO_07300 [Betaproteobacteria bacterium]